MPLACMLSAVAVAAVRPKHAAVFLIDDLGYGDTGHMGAEYTTPEIDALAMGGVRLNQSYVTQLCSPTRATLLASRYAYTMGMDGNVLTGRDTRCINASVTTLGEQMSAAGVKTAFIGKYDVGYSSWHCTANCRGWDYWLGYYGAAEDYYLHGSSKNLDFHENYDQAPQYRGEYSTNLFARKGVEWLSNQTAQSPGASTMMYVAFQAVHGPITAPPEAYEGCSQINEKTRHTYCLMMKALDAGIGNITAAYKSLGIFNDTVFLFLADNGGMNSEGGYNIPLRGGKATVWEGGVRSQTFVHWAGFDSSVRGSVYGGLAHAVDWGVTLVSALGYKYKANPGEAPVDGMDLWPALSTGSASPRTEMLLSMRDSANCSETKEFAGCTYRGELAFRRGNFKLIYGHPSLRGTHGDECEWTAKGPDCWNGWGVPKDVGSSRPPKKLPQQPGQPANTSAYQWGVVLLFDIENDPLEEHDLAARKPNVVASLIKALQKYNVTGISQDVNPIVFKGPTTEKCGDNLACSVPFLPHDSTDICKAV